MKQSESNYFSTRKLAIGILLCGFFVSFLLLTSNSIFDAVKQDLELTPPLQDSLPQALTPPLSVQRLPISGSKKLNPTFMKNQVHVSPYIDKLYDHFEMDRGQLYLRQERRTFLDHPTEISWDSQVSAKTVQGHLSQRPDFNLVASAFNTTTAGRAIFQKVYIGKNYYRLAEANKAWSKTESFEITAIPLPITNAIRIPLENSYFILESQVSVDIEPVGDKELKNFVMELSPFKSFPPKHTQVFWTNHEPISLNFSTDQVLYVRARGVNSREEITAPSQVHELRIITPAQPQPPILARSEYHIVEDEAVSLVWDQAEQNMKTHITIENNAGKVVREFELQDQAVTLDDFNVGIYTIQLRGVDRFKRRSLLASQVKVYVSPQAPLMLPLAQTEPPRLPTSIETSMVYKPEIAPMYLNRYYQNSQISVEGAGFTIYSSKLTSENQKAPLLAGIGVRLLTWFDNHGIESSFKYGSGSSSSASGDSTSVTALDLEARYRYRFTLPINPFSRVGTSQLALLFGFEHHENNNPSGYFAPKYDLGKMGINLLFPISSQWSTGGEMILGQGLDQSKKYEISGFLDYYIKRNWVLGGGYRVHLFEAGSLGSAPAALPFREGFGEGYTTLKWIY